MVMSTKAEVNTHVLIGVQTEVVTNVWTDFPKDVHTEAMIECTQTTYIRTY